MPGSPEDARDERFMDLFEAALDLPAETRREWLTRECANDPALAYEVLASLEAEAKMQSFLLQPMVPRPDAEPELAPDQELGERLRIVRKIAEGGMATVYEAIDSSIGTVAVKVPKQQFRGRLIAEARHSLRVTHPNICRVHNVHSARAGDRGVDYLTMELLDGETLQSRITREGPPPLPVLRAISEQIARGLDEAHRQGVVHADLKGNNVILTEDPGGQIRAVITDFGISRQHESGAAPIASTLRGAPEFVAPELWEGHSPSPASDLYAFGVLLYEAGTGIRRHEKPVSPRKIRSELPEAWSDFVCRCLERDPERRPRSALDVIVHPSTGAMGVRGALGLALLLMAGGAAAYRLGPAARPAEPVRLAIIPPDADADSAALGTGMLRQVAAAAGRFRNDAGPVIVVPWAEGADPESDARAAGATHLIRVRFRSQSAGLRASGALEDVPSRRDLRTFGGTYSRSSMASIPQAIIGAVSAALGLQGPDNPVRVSATAWPDYARGLGYLQATPANPDAALEALRSAAEKDASSALPWAHIVEAYLLKYSSTPRAEFLDQAQSALRQAEMRDPDDLDVHLAAGLFYTHGSLPERAVVELGRVLQKEPGNVDAVRRLARAYGDMNLPEEAIRTWDKAIAMLPTDYRTHLDAGQFYYRRSQYREAAKHWTEVTKLAPALGRGFHNLGAVLNDMGRYQEAEAAFSQALRLQENPNTLLGFGSILAYQGRVAEAVPYFEKAVQMGPRNHIMMSNLGDTYRWTGRTADARKAYQEALAIADGVLIQQPRDAYVRAYVAYISARLGDRSRAEREAEQAVRFAPGLAKAIRVSALALAAAGHTSRALEVLESVPWVKRELSRHPDAGLFAGQLRVPTEDKPGSTWQSTLAR